MVWMGMFRRLVIVSSLLISLMLGISGCSIPQVSAEQRLFLDLSLDVLDVYTLPPQMVEETPVGGLSAIAYDPQRDRLYAVSDDRSRLAPARFYTLQLQLDTTDRQAPKIQAVNVESVTLLRNQAGETYAPGSLDAEGLALSPRQTLMISSEGDLTQGIPPALGEYDLATGQIQTTFRLPDRYLPNPESSSPQGVQNNLGLEALAVNVMPMGNAWVEPFRLFTAPESALLQDYDGDPAQPLHIRLLHYLIGQGQSTLISEHLYPLELEASGTLLNGLSDFLVLDQSGHFLALERTFGLKGMGAKLFQLSTGGATDTSTLPSLKGNSDTIIPIRKQLELDFATLNQPLDNLEGITLGPPLPDRSQSLILISDNNFREDQATQIWLLRLHQS